MKLLLIFTVITSIILSCTSEEIKKEIKKSPSETIKSCSFDLLNGECTEYEDQSYLCSVGKCIEGDCINGKGKLTYSNGSFLEATFKKGKIVEGSISYNKCGDKFVGIFSNTTSKGTHTYRDGSTYEGSIINGKKEGKGVLTYSDGSVYEGDWMLDKKHGKGVETVGKFVSEGSWKEGKRDGEFIIKDLNSNTSKKETYIDGNDEATRNKISEYYSNQRYEASQRKDLRNFIYKMYELGAYDIDSCNSLCIKHDVLKNNYFNQSCWIQCRDAMEINK